MRRDAVLDLLGEFVKISTHAPRVRRDLYGFKIVTDRADFYSRASCEARPARP